MATNRLRHFNGCSIEELEPSHLQPRDECPATDGLSCCGVGTCGHMRPPSKGCLIELTKPIGRLAGEVIEVEVTVEVRMSVLEPCVVDIPDIDADFLHAPLPHAFAAESSQ